MKKIAILTSAFVTILAGSAVWAYSRTNVSPVSVESPAIEVSGNPADVIALLDMMPLPRELEEFAQSDKRHPDEASFLSSDLQKLSPSAFERGWRIVIDGDSYLTISAKASAGSAGKTLLDMIITLENSPFSRSGALQEGDKRGIEQLIDVVATEYVRDVTNRIVPNQRIIGKRVEARLGVFDRWILKGVTDRAEQALMDAMGPLAERMKAAMASDVESALDQSHSPSGAAASMAAGDAISAADIAKNAARDAAQAAGAPYEQEDDDSTGQTDY